MGSADKILMTGRLACTERTATGKTHHISGMLMGKWEGHVIFMTKLAAYRATLLPHFASQVPDGHIFLPTSIIFFYLV